jgi:hypothetical protein
VLHEPSEAVGVAHAGEEAWAVIARFGNAAEAGYFADELDYALGFEPRLDCRDDFDAVHHHWRSRFVLSVPARHAEQAREVLTCLLEGANPAGTSREERLDSAVPFSHTRLGPRRETTRSPGSNVKWAPLFITLAAGSLAFWHGKKPPAQRQPFAPNDALRIQLGEAPGLRDAPWVQTFEGGLRRELHFPAHDGEAVLREDCDGDGIFEREYTLETH